MLNETMAEVRNHFAINRTTGELHGAESGEFTLANGKIAVKNKYVVGQYIAISGSILNNGVYRVEGFTDGVINLTQTAADYPDWIRPTGVPTAYNTGDRVRHNNLRWVSLQDINTIEPGWPGTNDIFWSIVPGVEIENPFTNEEWRGTIYSLVVKHEFLMLVERINEFAKSPMGKPSNIIAAGFGIQNQTFATNSSGAVMGWKETFESELNTHRRMFPDIVL